jgi:hypothetical protein
MSNILFTNANLAVFAVSGKLSAIQILFATEILGRRRFEQPNNSEGAAVFLLFFVVVVDRSKTSQATLNCGIGLSAAHDEIRMSSRYHKGPLFVKLINDN